MSWPAQTQRRQRDVTENSVPESIVWSPDALHLLRLKKEMSMKLMMSGNHSGIDRVTSIDSVKGMFVDRMKSLSEARSSTESSSTVKTVATTPNDIMRIMMTKGWAITERSNFRYSFEQKVILYRLFMEGEETGAKVSPEAAEKVIRQEMKDPEHYVTVQQIRSLFSTWSKSYREGKLKPPEKKKAQQSKKKTSAENTASDDEIDEIDESACVQDDDEAVEYHNCLTNAVADVCSQWEVDDWVVVKYDNDKFPGQITTVEDGGVLVDCMHECFPGESRNHFRWPHPRDNTTLYDTEQILCSIKQPEKPTNSRGAIKLADDDFQKFQDLLC